MAQSLAKLHAQALALYDKEATEADYRAEFTPLQLCKLWHEYCVLTPENTTGAPYDDEVYDALDTLGYFDYI